MVYIIPADRCNCKTCHGGFPAPPGVYGGSKCACRCHAEDKQRSLVRKWMEYLKIINPTEPPMTKDEPAITTPISPPKVCEPELSKGEQG